MERDDRYRQSDREDLDEERDTQIRRDTQVRGSLGMPASGEKSERPMKRDDSIPEFERMDDEDRGSER